MPLTNGYYNADLIADLKAEVIIVARLGLGTINHTLLTINEAQRRGLKIKGIVFCQTKPGRKGLPESTNPQEIEKLSGVKVLGHHSLFKTIKPKEYFTPMSKSQAKRLKQWDKEYIWHPFTQMKDWVKDEPLIIDSADGIYLKDIDGNIYMDGVSSLWVNVHGHRQAHIDAALKKQIDKLSHSTLLGLSNTPSIELAKRLVEIAPEGFKESILFGQRVNRR